MNDWYLEKTKESPILTVMIKRMVAVAQHFIDRLGERRYFAEAHLVLRQFNGGLTSQSGRIHLILRTEESDFRAKIIDKNN